MLEEKSRGNSQTLKTLMQVSDITSSADSIDNQKIIVEITDPWTLSLVEKIIETKEVKEKCNIIPVKVNEVLGQLLSQFCLMPELNGVYSELFSNKGAEFHSVKHSAENEIAFVTEYLKNHNAALPITIREEDGESYAFFVADEDVGDVGDLLEAGAEFRLAAVPEAGAVV